MIVLLEPDADAPAVERALIAEGLWVRRLDGIRGVQLEIEPWSSAVAPDRLLDIQGVADVLARSSPHPRVDAQRGAVEIARRRFAPGGPPVLIAGPCAVESERQIDRVAARVARAGASFLRGGAFKPRTSPYSFHGHGTAALGWLRRAADREGLAVVTEVLSPEDAPLVAEHADMLQIGSRSMQSFALLKAAGQTGRAVMLKRGMSATVEEWLLAAEYCLVHGAFRVVLCERGIRGFDTTTRNLLDLSAVALLSHIHRLPVVVDPSHAVGRRDLIAPLTHAALAAGAAGVMLETHDDPGQALSDGAQALTPECFDALARSMALGGAS